MDVKTIGTVGNEVSVPEDERQSRTAECDHQIRRTLPVLVANVSRGPQRVGRIGISRQIEKLGIDLNRRAPLDQPLSGSLGDHARGRKRVVEGVKQKHASRAQRPNSSASANSKITLHQPARVLKNTSILETQPFRTIRHSRRRPLLVHLNPAMPRQLPSSRARGVGGPVRTLGYQSNKNQFFGQIPVSEKAPKSPCGQVSRLRLQSADEVR